MKKLLASLMGVLAFVSNSNAEETQISAKESAKFGVSPTKLAFTFRQKIGINLNPNETLRVNKYAEGKSIRFETLDHHSVVVDINRAAGSFNKVGSEKSNQ